MSTATWDLIYVIGPQGSTISCAIQGGQEQLVGPFGASEGGPKIVDALLACPELGFTTKKQAEQAYIVAHFGNMTRGCNRAGQAYPWKVD